MEKKILFLMILFSIKTSLVFGQTHQSMEGFKDLESFTGLAIKGPWDKVKNKEGVELSYRPLNFSDTLKTRELCIRFHARASIKTLLKYIKEPQKVKQWSAGIRSIDLLRTDDETWISHATYNIPFPLSQKDLVAKYSVSTLHGKTIVSVKSLPNYIPRVKGVNREQFHLGQWVIEPESTGHLKIEFSVVSLSNSNIPRFVKDPIVQRTLLNSFISLKKQIEFHEKPY